MKNLTPQQIAAAAAKRAASIAQRKATGGMTVRQQRAAAKAAKAGQTFTPPPPRPTPPPSSSTFTGRRRRSRFNRFNTAAAPRGQVVTPAAPLFAPKPDARALKLAALVAIEEAFKSTPPATVTQDMRDAWDRYQKMKTRALAPSLRPEDANEANTALLVATASLVKLAF